MINTTSLRISNRDSSYFSAVQKSYDLYRKYGFLPDEARKLGLFRSDDIEGRFISKSHLVKLQEKLNHPSFQNLTEDKALFYTYCARVGVPTPRLLGIFFKQSSGWSWEGASMAGERQWSNFFEQACPDEFVVKPSGGVYGDGILFVDKTRHDFSGIQLFRSLREHPRYDSFVIQEYLTNHSDLMRINPKKGLQTVRVITYVNDDQAVEILMAYLKPITGENRVDNHKGGVTGNLLCPINLSDGLLGDLAIVGDSGVTRMDQHPDTGAVMKGLPMPLWSEICQLAKSAALAFLPMRSIGWDIAVTPGGAFIIEGNARWDPPKFGDVSRILRAAKEIGAQGE